MTLVLLLLVCSSPALIQSLDQGSDLQDPVRSGSDHVVVLPDLSTLWDELRGLKVLVLSLKAAEVDQRQVLRSVETRLRDGQEELKDLNQTLRTRVEEVERLSAVRGSQLSAEVSDLQSRLNIGEVSTADLKQKNTVLAAELPFIQTRLQASEHTVEELRRRNAVVSVRLCNTESLLEDLRRRSSESPVSNNSSGLDLNIRLEDLSRRTEESSVLLSTLQMQFDSFKDRWTHHAQGDVTEDEQSLNSTQHHLEELRTHTEDHSSKLMDLQTRLNTTENLNIRLASELEFKLRVAEKHLEDLRTEHTVQFSRIESRFRDDSNRSADQSSKLTDLQKRLNTTENLTIRLASELEFRLGVAEKHLEDLRTEHTDFKSSLRAETLRLDTTDEHVEDLRKHITDAETELVSVSDKLMTSQTNAEDFKSSLWAVTLRLNTTDEQVEDLRKHITDAETELVSVSNKLMTSQTNAEDFKSSLWAVTLRLDTSDEQVEELRKHITDAETELVSVSNKLMTSQTNTKDFKSSLWAVTLRLNTTDEQVEDLRKHITDAETELVSVSNKLVTSQTNAEDFKSSLWAVTLRLDTTDEQVEDLRKHITDAETELVSVSNKLMTSQTNAEDFKSSLFAVTLRLNTTDEQVEDLRKHITDAETELVSVSNKLMTSQTNTEDFKSSLWAVTLRLNTTDEQVEDLRKHITDAETELVSVSNKLMTSQTNAEDFKSSLWAVTLRLNTTDEQVEELRKHITDAETELVSVSNKLMTSQTNAEELGLMHREHEKQLNELKTEASALTLRLNKTEHRLQQINRTSDQENVAFSAGLTDSGSVGPFTDETTLVFSKTITNIGGAYNRTTGVFSAPLRGLYFFSFTAADYLKGYMGIHLLVNEQPVLFSLDLNAHGGYASMSNGLVLNLDRGDQVRLSLPASYRLYDDSRNFSIFSGFLLFTL